MQRWILLTIVTVRGHPPNAAGPKSHGWKIRAIEIAAQPTAIQNLHA